MAINPPIVRKVWISEDGERLTRRELRVELTNSSVCVLPLDNALPLDHFVYELRRLADLLENERGK